MSRAPFAVGIMVVVLIGTGWAAKRLASSANSPITPLTATEVEAIYEGESPVMAYTETTSLAVRSDGSYVTLRHFPDPNGGVRSWSRRGITDVSVQEFIGTDPFSESVSTYPMTGPQVAHELKKFTGSCNGKSAGSLLGFDVVTNQTVDKEPAGPNRPDTNVTTYWQALNLDCLPLRTETLLYQAGKLTQRTIKTVTYVKLGEPPNELFDRPANYIERAPSEARREAERRYPNHDCCRNISQDAEQYDKRYYERRHTQ